MPTMLFLALLLLSPVNVPGQPQATGLDAKLGTRVSQYSLSANGLADALIRTAKKFQLPMGIEWVKDKRALRGFSRTWKGDTVGAILRSVVGEYPGYSFRVEHGVIHVFRSDWVNDSRNFLNLKVPQFVEVREEVGGLANVRLREAVQTIVSPRNLPPGAGEGGSYSSGNVPEKPLTLTLRGLTVREALDELVVASEHKMWVVTFSGNPDLTPTGFRRTETLWHPTPFPDIDQPMWDFLAWEGPLPYSATQQSPEK